MEKIEGKENEAIPLEKKFITSLAEVSTHRKMQLRDAEVAKKYKQQFKQLCKELGDIFSKDSTPLITMDIDTGDSPLACQNCIIYHSNIESGYKRN